jgi:hypothetical protein
MKQVLSIADFVVITNLLNKEIHSIESYVCRKFGKEGKHSWNIIPAELLDKKVQEFLSVDKEYQSLLHLKNSLETLNIEVETPDVAIKGE